MYDVLVFNTVSKNCLTMVIYFVLEAINIWSLYWRLLHLTFCHRINLFSACDTCLCSKTSMFNCTASLDNHAYKFLPELSCSLSDGCMVDYSDDGYMQQGLPSTCGLASEWSVLIFQPTSLVPRGLQLSQCHDYLNTAPRV